MELFDLYNKNHECLNTTMERNSKPPQDAYRLVVHACIFNNEGKMLVQQRQSFKVGWANYWDLTAGGSVISGEDSESAVKRELYEELSIDLSNENLRPHVTIHFNEGFNDIYLIEKEIDISKLKLQEEEVKTVKWASQDEICDMIKEGKFIPYHYSLINLLFFMKGKRTTEMQHH